MPSYSGVWTLTAQYQAKGANNWPSAPVLEAGVSATFKSSANVVFTSVCALSTTTAVIVYADFTNNNVSAVVATLSGTTITYGTPAVVRTGYSPFTISCAALSATKVVVAYETTSANTLGAVVLTISGTTITVGSEASTSPTAQYVSLVPLTSTTALCVYSAGALVISASGTTPSFGSLTAYPSGGVNSTVQVSLISSTKAVLIRQNSANNYPTVNVITVSGTTVTMGANYIAEAVASSTSSPWVGIASINSTDAIATWKNATGNLPRAVAMTISGTAVTFGTVQSLGSTSLNASSNQSMAPASSTQAVFSYVNGTTGYVSAYVLTASGTTLSVSAPTVTVETSGNAASSLTQMNGKILLNPYRNSTSLIGAAQVLTVL